MAVVDAQQLEDKYIRTSLLLEEHKVWTVSEIKTSTVIYTASVSKMRVLKDVKSVFYWAITGNSTGLTVCKATL